MYEVKTSLPPKTPYLDLVKSKEGAGEGGGRGGRYGNKHFSFYSYSSLLISCASRISVTIYNTFEISCVLMVTQPFIF